MDPLSPLYDKALDGVFKWLKQEVTYLFSYKSLVDNLKEKTKELDNARIKVKHQVDDEERKGKEIEAEVENWLEDVKKIIEKHEQKNVNHTNTKCFYGFFPNPWSRYTLGKQACKMAQEVGELQNKSRFDGIAWQGPISMESALSNINYKSFDSRKEIIDKVKEKLKDSNVRMIGVYGAGGVGKTTLVKQVAIEVRDKFKVLVLESLTRNPDQKKIQGAIADFLGLKLDEESEIGRADRIRERLKKEKKDTLIILDDLWGGLDLNGLGIPIANYGFSRKPTMKAEGMSNSDCNMNAEKEKSPVDQRILKILLTSRSSEVLSTQMGVDEKSIFFIGDLNEKEADALFKKAAKVIEKGPEFEPLVAKILKKCLGLPIAIITIGKALQNKSLNDWHGAVQQLERKGLTGMSGTLEFPTRLSFNSLENEELKSAFLLCAQMGTNPLTMDLMKYCYGLSILQGVHTIKEAQDRILQLINVLKGVSLLTESTSNDHFNMHDMVRDAALSILANERHAFTMRDEKLDEWPDKDELKRLSSISLYNCQINDDLPEGTTFPKLKFFHINNGHPFIKIPDNFKGATRLRVLILTDIPLPHLPFSNESIKNSLRMLCLERCLLSDTDNLSIIGEMKKLRILSFSGSRIEKLPSELKKLSNLQWFDISNCSQLRVIAPNVLSCLDSLEVIYMRDSPIQWGFEGQPNLKIQNATLAELSHLHQLNSLDVCIPDAIVFPRNLFLDMLDSYKIVIGDPNLLSKEDFTMPKKYEASKALVLQLKEGVDIHTHKGIKMLLRTVEKLLLGELHGIDNVFDELNLEGFLYLKHFCIQNNSNIECIIDSKVSNPHNPFPNLESLCLYNLENLKTICRIKLTGSSFGNLKSIKIKDCTQLKNIFPISMVRLLTKLETFEVSNCPSLKSIVVGEEKTNIDGEVDSKIEFPQLRSLTLQLLPEFTCFYDNGVSTSPFVIFNEQVEIPKLETLELSSINDQIQKIWNDWTSPSSCLKNLVKLKVDGCKGLTYLFSFSDAKDLEILKTISVCNCDKIDKIIMQEEISSTEEKVCILPKLEEINLDSMMSLSEIWHFENVRVHPFRTLSSVIIRNCEKLVTVFPRYMVGLFPRLEKLVISRCDSVIVIFDLKDAPRKNEAGNETNLTFVDIWSLPNLKHVWNQDPQGILSFKNMQKIEVYNCENLGNLFPPSFAKGLENLDHLSIIACPKLDQLIAWDKGPETSDISLRFPRLTFLEFSSLPKLEGIYRGRHTLEWPLLNKLVVGTCDKLEVIPIPIETKNQANPPAILAEEVISDLEYMNLSQKEAERLHRYVNSHQLRRLRELHFNSLESNAILYKILHRIPNLEKLSLSSGHLKELLTSGSLDAHEKIGTVIQIKQLELSWMYYLENIGFEHDPVLQRVECLSIPGCSSLISLAPSTVSFAHLRSLEVSYCSKLLNLMGSSTAKSLVKLAKMKVTRCEAMTEIVARERNEEEKVDQHEIVFRKLKTLELESLEHLTSFCNCKNHNLNFPILENLIVRECPKMKIFCESLATAPILRQVSLAYAKDEGKWLCECDLNAAFTKISTEMVSLKYTHYLELSKYPELERAWHGQVSLPDGFFTNLTRLEVTDCHFLSSVIPFHLLAHLNNLETLQVSNCKLVEVIFDMNDTKTNFGLKTLSLKDLPSLKHVWSKDLQGLIRFRSLQDVSVEGCNCIKALFPKYVAKNLLKLEMLKITNCGALEEIVRKEDAAADGAIDEMFEFPRLASLELSELPELKCFINLKCPRLEDLRVNHWGKLEIFKSESQRYEKAASEDQIIPTGAQALFSVQEDPELERVCHGQVSLLDDCFCNLKSLAVTDCDFLSSVIPFHLLACLSNLEKLRLSNCNQVEVIFDMNDTKMTKTGEEAFRLKTLSLDDLPNLKHVWSMDPQGLISFRSLQDVSVDDCKRLKTIFPKSVAKNLLKLEKLSIRSCQALEEIVGKEESAADGAIDEMFDFPRLAKLWLFKLPELKCFFWGRFNLKSPMLEDLYVDQCGKFEIFKSESQSYEKAALEGQIIPVEAQSLFSVQEVISTLREVALNERDIKMLWRGGFTESLQNLKWLQLRGFHNVNEIDHLPFEILQKVPNLETLLVDCCDFKEISFSGIFEDYHVTMVAPFKRLELCELPRLNSIGSKHSSIDSVLENLEALDVNRCPCLTKLIQSSVPFSSLKELHIDMCDGLVHLFTSSIVRSLVKLEEIHVKRCESIIEIVAEKRDDSDTASEILFEQLKVLDLNSLPSLGSFYSGSSTLKFPYLKDVKIIKCPRMNTFSNGITEVTMLGTIQVSEKNSLKVHGLKSIVDKLFNEKISFAYMEVLNLFNYPELEPLWLGKIPLQENCFSNLKTLMVENCEFLSNVIPSNLLPYLKSLEELRVRNCTSVEVIFDINEIMTSEIEQKGFLLKKLTLDRLPNLKLVWNKNPQRIMSFEKLQKVKVSDCKSLQYLFPIASMAKHLLKLKVQNCEALEEILGKEEASETFEFRYLTTVILNHLPELNCFYPGRLNLKCPKLKVSNVYHCGKLEMFTSETRSNQEIPENQVGVSVNAPPIFAVEEVTPELEEVSLNERETMTLWHEEYQANFLHNIKSLQLYCFHTVTNQEDTLPYGFLHKVPNLEILAVACSDFKMIFPSRELEDDYIGVLSKLKGLRLEALSKLSSIGLEHSWLVALSENLETLEIRICSSLTNIVQSVISFSNLKEFTVIECHGLINLFTSSTAKSLGQLRKLSIGKCKSMREIVAKEEKELSEDEIVVFGELTKLSLHNLPNLGSFYPGDSSLRFPYLQEVIITQCSMMKIFSQGFISAPQLPYIKVSLEKWDVCWEGDLNSTVKKSCKGKEPVNP